MNECDLLRGALGQFKLWASASAPWTPASLNASVFLWQNPANTTPGTIGLPIVTSNPIFGTSNTGTALGLGPTLTSSGAEYAGIGTDSLSLGTAFVPAGDWTGYFVVNSGAGFQSVAVGSASQGTFVESNGSTISLEDDNFTLITGTGTTGLQLIRADFTNSTTTGRIAWTGNSTGVSQSGMGPWTIDVIGNAPGGGPSSAVGSYTLLQCLIDSNIVGTPLETSFLAWLNTNLGVTL